ncbi:MAG: glycosyltransferase [Armatimonadetes bacterium]|nr:glycosyltransferase [Armatimonadota bacterium]
MTPSDIFISVIICTHRRPDSLANTLESLVEQTWKGSEWELIVVENDRDASPLVAKVVQEFQDRLPVRWCMETVPNLSRARNLGAREGRGEYLAYLDDDVEVCAEWLEQVMLGCKEHSPDFCGGPSYPLYRISKPGWFKDEYATGYVYGNDVRELRDDEYFGGMNFTVRKELVQTLGGFREELGRAGNKIGWGEETMLMVEARKRYPNCCCLYLPGMAVKHEVVSQKMSIKWHIRHHWEAGFDYALANMTNASAHNVAISTCRIMASLASQMSGLLVALARSVFSPRESPWRRYLKERMLGNLFQLSCHLARLLYPSRRKAVWNEDDDMSDNHSVQCTQEAFESLADICCDDAERKEVLASWFKEDTADFWRHNRMYQIAYCVLHKRSATWLTVGDGRFGLDSIRLKKKGILNVTPSDISENLLAAAKEGGLIADYSVQDAQHMTFEDGSFDFVFCKESYHHLPQPALGLYEMLRVAREAVFLVEPSDPVFTRSPLSRLKQLALRVLRGRAEVYADYESVGNYVYSISRREIEKLALGLGLPHVVFKGLNDCYIKGVEFEPADVKKSRVFRKVRRRIWLDDIRCALGLRSHALLMAGLFKAALDQETRSKLKDNGWTVVDLPKNPYVDAD